MVRDCKGIEASVPAGNGTVRGKKCTVSIHGTPFCGLTMILLLQPSRGHMQGGESVELSPDVSW
jgi:hypothetical protein